MNAPTQTENGYLQLHDTGVLSLSGNDAAKLLQGQATCDILGLPPGQTTLGAFCTPKGRAYALFRVLRAEDRIFLLLPREMLEAVKRRLQMYVLRADVKIEDASAAWAVFGLHGAEAAALLQTLGLPPLGRDNEAEGQAGLLASVYAIRLPDERSPRLLLLADAAKADGVARFMESRGVPRWDAARWRLEDIRAGLPAVAAATAEAFVPQMLNLDLLGGVSFNKGCYTGQEIVARTHYLGQLKRRMYRLGGADGRPPEAGEAVLAEGGDAGTVVSAAERPEGGFEVLAVLHAHLAEGGETVLQTQGGGRLELLGLPYAIAQTGQ